MRKPHMFNKSYVEFNFNNMHKVREKYDGKIGLMCPNCYGYWIVDFHQDCTMTISEDVFLDDYEDNTNSKYDHDISPYRELIFCNMSKCPDCSSDNDLIMIDPNIVSIVSILNKKGYITTFSCEGHNDPDGSILPYILFNNMSESGQDIIKEAFSNSEYWNAYNSDMVLPYYNKTEMKYYNNNFMLDLKADKEIEDIESIKEKYLNELFNIVVHNLPVLLNNNYESTIKDYIASVESVLQSFKDKINDTDTMVRLAKQVYADVLEIDLT